MYLEYREYLAKAKMTSTKALSSRQSLLGVRPTLPSVIRRALGKAFPECQGAQLSVIEASDGATRGGVDRVVGEVAARWEGAAMGSRRSRFHSVAWG